MRPSVVAAALAALLMGCAHERVVFRNGCWIRLHESRLGDSREEVTVCEPRPPSSWSTDPMMHAVEQCTYQAQQAWYAAALLAVQRGSSPTNLPMAQQAAEFCAGEAYRSSLERAKLLTSKVEDLQAEAERLTGENDQLRGSLMTCFEKQPLPGAPATATANASTTSKSSSDADTDTRQARDERHSSTTTNTTTTASGPGEGDEDDVVVPAKGKHHRRHVKKEPPAGAEDGAGDQATDAVDSTDDGGGGGEGDKDRDKEKEKDRDKEKIEKTGPACPTPPPASAPTPTVKPAADKE